MDYFHALGPAKSLNKRGGSEGARDKQQDGTGPPTQSCRCRTCGRGFVDLETLSQHEASDHNSKQSEKCPVPSCEYHIKGFATQHDCAQHALQHYEASIICGYCADGTRIFNRADEFERHLVDIHDPFVSFDDSIKTKCPVCREVTLGAWDLSIHLRSCVIKQLKQLSSHKPASKQLVPIVDVTHPSILSAMESTEVPFSKTAAVDPPSQSGTNRRKHAATWQCHICPKSFTRALALRAHVNNHKGERPFKCDVCDLSFTRNNDRKTHQAIHGGERRFVCNTCGRQFSRAANLKRHERGHTRKSNADSQSLMGDKRNIRNVTDSQNAALVLTEIAGLELTLGQGFEETDYLDLNPQFEDDLHEMPWPGDEWHLQP